MRIAGYSANAVTRTSGLERAEALTAPAGVSASVALQLSATGQLMLQARQALRALPEMREQPIRDLGARLSSGRYHPDPQAIAAAMIAE
ncbi:MAG: flagellar biosynthesis anti-sigma factor FlgM [Armatimonadetes bacterium]|nr:flagellar biosynthesis anti-sigma factor FlgM [Armatimonadota bacterium]